MYRDFIVKQTSDFDSEYKAKTLVGNWNEERCNPSNAYGSFYKQRKLLDNGVVLHSEPFQRSTQNYINFQGHDPAKTFTSQYKTNYVELDNHKRQSVLRPFITKKSEFEKNQQALEEYRQKWTKSKHIFDKSRTYLGVQKK